MLSCRMTTRSVGEDDLVADIISAEEFVEEVCDIVEETLAFALGGDSETSRRKTSVLRCEETCTALLMGQNKNQYHRSNTVPSTTS